MVCHIHIFIKKELKFFLEILLCRRKDKRLIGSIYPVNYRGSKDLPPVGAPAMSMYEISGIYIKDETIAAAYWLHDKK